MGPILMGYADEVTKAMEMLARQEKTIFVGQAVLYDGQRLHSTLEAVPLGKRIEMPVCEEFQMGFCTGLALEGMIPIAIYPRWDFLLLAANQLVNHLDKIPLMGGFRPKVIVRTAVGSSKPLDPGHQHVQNYTIPFRQMLKTIDIYEIFSADKVMETYHMAWQNPKSCIVVEHMEKYA